MTTARPILVIGNSGQLAQALINAAGGRIIALGRPQIDLADTAGLKSAMARANPALVVNAAAYTAVDDAQSNEKAAFKINAEGPAALARLCAARALPLIHVSTDYVFDGSKTTAYDETDPPKPLGVYGHSKYAGETAIAQQHQHHIILRTSWLHSFTGKNFVKTMLSLAAHRDEINVVSDQFGNPTYAPHLAQAILNIADQIAENPKRDVWGTYHLANAGHTNWADFAKFIFAQSAALNGPTAIVHPISTAQYNSQNRALAPRPKNSRLNCAKAHSRFGIVMPDWQAGAQACIAKNLAVSA